MYEKVGSDIVGLLDKQKPYVADRADELHRAARTRLAAVHDLAGLLDGLVALDAVVAAWITAEVGRYRPDQAIAGQPDRSPTILGHARLLLAAYQRVLADGPAAQAAAASLGGVADLITVDAPTAGGRREGLSFVGKVRDFLVLALAVAARSRAGQGLVAQLDHHRRPVTVRLVYKEDPASLLAFPNGPGTHGTAVLATNPFAELLDRVAAVTPAGGGPSQVAAPVWLTDGGSAGMLTTGVWDRLTEAEALDRVLIGSLSFTRDRVAFYTPPRIEVLHELVHAAHNAAGENRQAHGGMTAAERAVWTDAEEFWTIAADPAGENALADPVGTPDRYGHSGLPLLGLLPSAAGAQRSLNDHAGH